MMHCSNCVNKLWRWISCNKEWVFNGIGVIAIGSLLAYCNGVQKGDLSGASQSNKSAQADGASTIIQIEKTSGPININRDQSPGQVPPVVFKVSDFQRIRVIEGEPGSWEDLTMKIPDIKNCFKPDGQLEFELIDCQGHARFLIPEFVPKTDFLVFGLGQTNPVFDIVFVNNTSVDLTIDQIGVEVLDTRRKIWFAGRPSPIKVPVTDQYPITIPRSICKRRPELESRETVECKLPLSIPIDLKDPYFLQPNSVFRYGINIIEDNSNLGNATLYRFFLNTNKGRVNSGIVYIVQ